MSLSGLVHTLPQHLNGAAQLVLSHPPPELLDDEVAAVDVPVVLDVVVAPVPVVPVVVARVLVAPVLVPTRVDVPAPPVPLVAVCTVLPHALNMPAAKPTTTKVLMRG